MYQEEKVSVSNLITSRKYSIVSREAFEIYAMNEELNPLSYILELDAYGYYMMNLLDYLIGNTDRHWGNWGFLIDNETNKPVSLHPLMDFNQAFQSYETLEGANCQTEFPRILTQKEAALEGWNQIAEIQEEWFQDREKEYEMLMNRMKILQ